MAKGDNLKAFLKAGLRARYRPAAAAALVTAGVLMSATAGWRAQEAAAAPQLAAIGSTASARTSVADLLRDQNSLRRLVQIEADLANDATRRAPDGKPFKYATPELDRAILSHIAIVQEGVDPKSNKAVDALYGIDDGMWAWMMRNHAADAGLASAMEGITVNGDGSIDAVNAPRLAKMLDLKNDPVAATKLFARWLSAEIMAFDGGTGRAPTRGEIEMIALTDSENSMNAAFTAREYPDTKLGPALRIGHGNWKRAFLVDSSGWRGAKEAMDFFEERAEKSYKSIYGRIPVRQVEAPTLDEDYTTADLRKDPERFARIVMDAAKGLSKSSRMLLDRISEAAGLERHDPQRDVKIAGGLVALAVTIDEIRGKDVSGGIYAIGEGQWLQAARAYGDPAFVESFAGGIEQRTDGRIHAKSAAQFGTFMRLRDHGPIATQIVLDKMIAQMAILQRDLGRLPATSEIVVSHLFGLAAGEDFGRAVDRDASIEPLRFSPDDPRKAWEDGFVPSAGGSQFAQLLKIKLDGLAYDRGHLIGEKLEQRADATPTMKP